MYRKESALANCSIARALEQVGDGWTLLIVRECTHGTKRFDEFHKQLGIARNILTMRLERLTERGILERYPLEERANTQGYRLTTKGEELYPVLVSLMQWGDRWASLEGKAPVVLVSAMSGQSVERIQVREINGTPLSFKEIRFEPGPGVTAATQLVIETRNARILEVESK
ncbi:winged helix-turn-helix transcriptional regulator [Paraburkholderia sp. B3]|uniref:winged helix-turn-helix transcriptional regulator n=1 Tax=Paraburkholderia sp. B3 TaxID=3134791 RepID=UPI003981ED53